METGREFHFKSYESNLKSRATNINNAINNSIFNFDKCIDGDEKKPEEAK